MHPIVGLVRARRAVAEHPEAPEFLFSMVWLPTEAEKVGSVAPVAAGLASAQRGH